MTVMVGSKSCRGGRTPYPMSRYTYITGVTPTTVPKRKLIRITAIFISIDPFPNIYPHSRLSVRVVFQFPAQAPQV